MLTRRHLPLSILVTLALGSAWPSTATAAPVTGEAESLTLNGSVGQTFADTTASGSRGLKLWSTGSATGTVTSRATRRIAVRARGESCDGAPRMVVGVDGRTALDTDVSATTWTDHAVDLPLADGAHEVTVRFANDFTRTGCDRNLLVDRVLMTSVAARPMPGADLYVDPSSQAKAQADALRATRPLDAALLDKIASKPQAFWFGEWSGDVRAAVAGVMSRAQVQGRVPVLVAYKIPQRDCGSYSAGGAASPDAYRSWIRSFADGIGSGRAVVVLEPDAVAGLDCLDSASRATRLELLADAVSVIAARPGTAVYLDAGHDAWHPAAVMAGRLKQAGIADAQGFSLNVSNFRGQDGLVAYGQQLAATIGVAHFVIDTSRNGLGPDPSGQWCNPSGRALGRAPATASDYRLDWNLWIKRPGESDGTCNGGPTAGAFWPTYAIGLAQRAAW